MEPCKFFAKGNCTRGYSCRYAHIASTKVQEPCKFFAKGHCERGDSCFYRHVKPSAPSRNLNGSTASFQPKLTTVINGTIGSSLIACRFSAKGYCKNGDNCRFEHTSDLNIFEGQQDTYRNSSSQNQCSRNLSGAQVIFGPGAEVECVNLDADFSAVQITGLTSNSRLEILQHLLSDLGFSIPIKKFRLKGSKDGRVVVEVKIKDPEFAKNLICKFDEEVVKGNGQEIDIKQVPIGSSNGPLGVSRFRTTSLLCSWSKSTRSASLCYRTVEAAIEAADCLREHRTIMGRNVRVSYVVPPWLKEKQRIAIQVDNLDALTRTIHFTSLLHGPTKPADILLHHCSHTKTDIEAENIVKELLIKQGSKSWEMHRSSGSSTATAWATFESREDGVKAIRNLNGTKIEQLGNCELCLTHVKSFTISLPVIMLQAMEREIDKWKSNVKREITGIHIKTYPPVHGASPYTILRISGEDVKAVARAKSELEVLLVGTVIENEVSALWDPYFGTAAGLEYLQDLQASNNVYIYRDTSKRRLTVHGMSRGTAAVRKALYRKVQSISESSHTIPLNPELLQRALSGGMQAITTKLGKSSATLNISHQPMSIKIKGSRADYELALTLLRGNSTATTKTAPKSKGTCVICWEEAVDPFSTPCYHTYCTECFINQCTAEDSFPIRCHGNEAKCTHIFSTTSLQNLLPSTIFEQLLETSFKTYIQTHSKDFQYCPTPDCSQIYRISPRPNTNDFDCPNCLASVCINCASISHDGITCADNRDIRAGYVQAFNSYKAKHDIRDCPTCKTPIEKIDGCNHMTCQGCKTHICWFCMRCFEEVQDCYDHMGEVHGGNGL